MSNPEKIEEMPFIKDQPLPELVDYEDILNFPRRLSDIRANLGAVTAGSIAGRSISTIAGAIDASGHFIDACLNTSTKQILGDFTFGASGAIKMITDADNGLWLSPTGILGKKAGATTFAIDIEGNATFAGTLSAAAGTLGTITAGTLNGLTITGGTIQTASSGKRVTLAGNTISLYDADNNVVGKLHGELGSQTAMFNLTSAVGENMIDLYHSNASVTNATILIGAVGKHYGAEIGRAHV